MKQDSKQRFDEARSVDQKQQPLQDAHWYAARQAFEEIKRTNKAATIRTLNFNNMSQAGHFTPI